MVSENYKATFFLIVFFGVYMAMVFYARFKYESELMKEGRKDFHYLFYDQTYVPPSPAPPKKNEELEHYYKIIAFYKRQGTGKRRNLNTNYVRPGRMPQPARHLEPTIRLQYMAMARKSEWPVYGDGHQMQKPNFIWTGIFVLISNLPRLLVFNDMNV